MRPLTVLMAAAQSHLNVHMKHMAYETMTNLPIDRHRKFNIATMASTDTNNYKLNHSM
jgi:hypothetical protein